MTAALGLFTEKGLDVTTIEDITERADVGKGTFYRHFANKDEVMQSLTEEAVDRLIAAIQSSRGQARTLDEALEHLVRAHTSFFLSGRDEFILLFQSRLLLKLERDDGAVLEETFGRYLDEIAAPLAPLVPQPLSPGRIRRLACAVAGFVQGFFSFAMLGMDSDEIETTLEPLRRAFVAGSSAFLGAIKPGEPREP